MKTISAGIVLTGLVGLTAGWLFYVYHSPANSIPASALHPPPTHPPSQDSSRPAIIQQISSVSEQDIWLANLKNEAALNPAEALKSAMACPSHSLQEEAISQVMLGWLSVNPEAALDWAVNLPADPLRQTALTCIGYELSRTQPELASEVLNELPDDAGTSHLAAYIATQRSLQNPMEAYIWADGLSHGNYRTNALSGILTVWAESNPGEAANLALTELPEGDIQERIIAGVLARWTQHQPELAAGWVEQRLPAGFFTIELHKLFISINRTNNLDQTSQ